MTQPSTFRSQFTPAARKALQPGTWSPAPSVDDRAAWSSIADVDRAALLDAAARWRDESLDDGPSLTLWMHYHATGDRQPYERAQRALLNAVASSALAVAITDDDAWLDVLADAVWRLCELTAWCLPSHYALPETGERPPLPIPGREILDLSDGYVGGMLAAIDAIAGDRLERAYPGLRARVHSEISRRVLEPWRRETYFWHGLDGPPNNWAPWIVSNVLVCAAVVETDHDTLEADVERGLDILDRFRAGYSEDGSCDEGATYWWWAGATLFEALDLVEELAPGTFDGFAVPPVAAMSRFPMLMQIADETQVNFSDGSPVLPPNASWHLLARFGERVDDADVVRHARWMSRTHPLSFDGQLAPLFRRTLAELRAPGWSEGEAAPGMPASWYAPGTELAVAREHANRTSGWFLSAKGGHNDVSHNHNDVGGVIVSLDGRPVLIDVGVGVYRRETFEPATRYTIWTMRSGWHSVPLPGGVEQQHGEQFRATDVDFSDDGSVARLSMELREAYPAAAGLTRCARTVSLDRGHGTVSIDDSWAFAAPTVMTLVLMTSVEPVSGPDGVLVVGDAELAYDTDAFTTVIESIAVDDDERLTRAWGSKVYRTQLVQRRPASAGDHSVRITRAAAGSVTA